MTPLAQASADKDRYREARLLRSVLIPLIALAIAGLAIALPLLSTLPLRTLFGLAATSTPGPALRAAAVLACIGTVVAIPLSVVESVRQAYQELHVNNLLSALFNAMLCLGLLLASWLHPTLPAFVAVTAFTPLGVRVLNAALLFHGRPYLLAMRQSVSWSQVRWLARDGLSYMGAAAIAGVLLYQWPVYYMARVRAPLESSRFAVFVQLILVALSFGTSLALPLWGAIADACARADYAWIRKLVRRARVAALAYGICGLIVFGLRPIRSKALASQTVLCRRETLLAWRILRPVGNVGECILAHGARSWGHEGCLGCGILAGRRLRCICSSLLFPMGM